MIEDKDKMPCQGKIQFYKNIFYWNLLKNIHL